VPLAVLQTLVTLGKFRYGILLLSPGNRLSGRSAVRQG
jgi:hypothetical protein